LPALKLGFGFGAGFDFVVFDDLGADAFFFAAIGSPFSISVMIADSTERDQASQLRPFDANVYDVPRVEADHANSNRQLHRAFNGCLHERRSSLI